MIEEKINLKLFKILTYFTFILIILVVFQISLGAAVRLTGSGLSCPDWPLCYGLWVPLKSQLLLIEDVNYEYYQIMLEWFHRLNAAILIAPLTLLVSFIIIKICKTNSIKNTVYLVLFTLFIQGLVGGFTVLDKNSAWSVAVHLGFALFLLMLIIRIFIYSKTIGYIYKESIKRKNLFVYIFTLILVFLTMLMGAIVSKSGSSLACDLWPLCSRDNMSIFHINKFIHITHRILALVSSFLVVWSFILMREFKGILYIQYIRKIVLILLLTQIFIGALVIFFEVNIVIAMIHQILAVLLFMMLSAIFWVSLDFNYKAK
tara:strand:+ start:3435 stop:4385 length:951 start_codon:yes stop_codon:yes gene_type:complete